MSCTSRPERACAPVEELLRPDPLLVERIVSSEKNWEGRIFSAQTLEVRLPNGNAALREVAVHHGGAAVCAVRDRRLCLVRQYRVAQGRMTLEIPAGRLEEGESPADCAARELLEETGLVASHLEFVARSLGSPGFTNEATSIYLASDLHAHDAHPDEGELVATAWVDLQDVLEAIEAGIIQDAKTIIAALVADHRGLG